MKTILAIMIALCVALPAAAQTTDVGVWVTRQFNDEGGRFAEAENAEARFDEGNGYGVSVSHRFGTRLSAEVAAFRTSSSARVIENSETFRLGDVELTPITAMLRYHFVSDRKFDVYAGAGIAHVSAEDLDSEDLRRVGFAPVRLDDETNAVLGAGASLSLSPRISIALDARYIPLELSGRVPGQDERFGTDVNPLLISAGLKLTF